LLDEIEALGCHGERFPDRSTRTDGRAIARPRSARAPAREASGTPRYTHKERYPPIERFPYTEHGTSEGAERYDALDQPMTPSP
jgi:hypothetical protein